MKDHDKNKDTLYLTYRDVNNLYRWPLSQMLRGGSFEWI